MAITDGNVAELSEPLNFKSPRKISNFRLSQDEVVH
jgi:hypothetical protein